MADGKEKEWRCQNKACGAILGMIRWNGNQVPQLMLLRHSLDMNMDRPAEVDLIGPLIGQMPVRCECCDHVSLWGASIDAMVALLESLSAEQKDELRGRLESRNEKRSQKRRARAVME